MLSSQNDGKYLSKRWAELRAQALTNPEDFTAWELEWLEISPGTPREPTDETFLIDTSPVDPQTPVRRRVIDIRTLPGH